jgi:hypothetical protein
MGKGWQGQCSIDSGTDMIRYGETWKVTTKYRLNTEMPLHFTWLPDSRFSRVGIYPLPLVQEKRVLSVTEGPTCQD